MIASPGKSESHGAGRTNCWASLSSAPAHHVAIPQPQEAESRLDEDRPADPERRLRDDRRERGKRVLVPRIMVHRSASLVLFQRLRPIFGPWRGAAVARPLQIEPEHDEGLRQPQADRRTDARHALPLARSKTRRVGRLARVRQAHGDLPLTTRRRSLDASMPLSVVWLACARRAAIFRSNPAPMST